MTDRFIQNRFQPPFLFIQKPLKIMSLSKVSPFLITLLWVNSFITASCANSKCQDTMAVSTNNKSDTSSIDTSVTSGLPKNQALLKDVLEAKSNQQNAVSENKKFGFFDSNIISALIQVVALVIITWWAGTWLHRKQSAWDQIRAITQIGYQWKYDFFKSFSQFTLAIGPVLGKYGRYIKDVEVHRQSGSKEEDIAPFIDKVFDHKLEIIKIGDELARFINHSRILFDSMIFKEIETLNNVILDIVKDDNFVEIDIEKAREIGARFATVSNMIAAELERDIGTAEKVK